MKTHQERYPGATIDSNAVIDYRAVVNYRAIIRPGAVIGSGADIGSGAVIGSNAIIGDNAIIGSNAIVKSSTLGTYTYNVYEDLQSGILIKTLRFGCVILPLDTFRANLQDLCDIHDPSIHEKLSNLLDTL